MTPDLAAVLYALSLIVSAVVYVARQLGWRGTVL